MLGENMLQKVLVGSPVLESLELYRFCGLTCLDIGSVSLRILVLRDYWDPTSGEDFSALEISAPNLQSLDILGRIFQRKLRLIDMQSLDNRNLDFVLQTSVQEGGNDFEVHRNMVGEILDRLRHVRELTLGNYCIQVLSTLELNGMLSPLPKCKCLILNTDIKKSDAPGIVGLL